MVDSHVFHSKLVYASCSDLCRMSEKSTLNTIKGTWSGAHYCHHLGIFDGECGIHFICFSSLVVQGSEVRIVGRFLYLGCKRWFHHHCFKSVSILVWVGHVLFKVKDIKIRFPFTFKFILTFLVLNLIYAHLV